MHKLIIALFVIASLHVFGQQTVGLISYDEPNTYQGYTLIYPHNQSTIYLVNNCGMIVHSWPGEEGYRPGNVAYLQNNGDIILTKRPADISQDAIWAGGGGAIIEIKDWDNNVKWTYELNNEQARLHHDIEITPEGTILAVAWELKTYEESINAGRDTATMTQGELWPDFVFEINPENDSIIWEWHAWDHIIQEHNPSAENFGLISDNQRKINLNWDTNNGKADWLHINSIDYNPSLDQIMLSVPQFHEVWVIDHSTTTQQAKTSQGGKSNHGGDIIYRVGNPMTYGRGNIDDKIFFFQHDAHWILDVPESHPYYGQVALFNNRIGEDYSTAEIFETPWMDYLIDYEQINGTWQPYHLENTIEHPDMKRMHSTGLSSIQLLPNGNTLICSGRQGYIFELDETKEKIVWEYITPLNSGNSVDQGTELELNNNLTFRAHKYSVDHQAFLGRDLSPKGWIETSPNETYCEELILNVNFEKMSSSISPNPSSESITINWNSGMMVDISVTDVTGQLLLRETGNGGTKYLDISILQPGVYFISVDNQITERLIKI